MTKADLYVFFSATVKQFNYHPKQVKSQNAHETFLSFSSRNSSNKIDHDRMWQIQMMRRHHLQR